MVNIWFISDTHFFHTNMLKFTDKYDKHFRGDLFRDTHEMNETIAANWNDCVRPADKVYHLGDVTFRYDRPFRELMYRLNGKKRLILGNHDRIKGTPLMDYFEKVELWKPWQDGGFILSHLPLGESQLNEKRPFSVHGHIHQNDAPTDRHINICVERTGYAPVSLDWIMQTIKDRT